nr:hypothetical protein [Tanacetum cinerariifolium]
DSPLLEVNTPKSDEDRLELMELMVFLMINGVCGEFGFNAARLFKFLLSGKSVIKRSDDVTRLQALVNKKRIVITEEVVREILQLDDVEGVICLPNDEIFAGLAQEEVQVPAQDDVAQENVIAEVIAEVVPPTPTSQSPPSPVIPSSPPYQSPSPPQSQASKGSYILVQHVLEKCSALVLRVEGLENANAAQQLEIVKLKARVKKLERLNKEDTKVQEAIEVVTTAKLITEVVTAATQVAAASTPISAAKPNALKIAAAALAVSTRKRKGVVIRDPEEELHDDTLAETLSVKDKGKGILVEELENGHGEAYKNIDWNTAYDHVQSKGTQYIKRYHGFKKKPQSESEARKNMIAYLKNTEGFKMAYFKGKTYDQILPIFQARFDANLIFLFKSREEMEKEDKEIIKSINETPAQKAAKRRKQNEEAQKLSEEAQRQSEEAQRLTEEAQEADDLRGHLEIVPNEDDDMFVEAVPLAQKAPIVDYQVVVVDNKPKYKIIRADDTH